MALVGPIVAFAFANTKASLGALAQPPSAAPASAGSSGELVVDRASEIHFGITTKNSLLVEPDPAIAL
jgi:hypothetical protein